MAATGEGFVKVQFNGLWMGQKTLNTFWYGFAVGETPTTFVAAEAVAQDIVIELEENPDTAPSVGAWRLPFSGAYILSDIEVWVKGATGVELAVSSFAADTIGSRAPTGDPLPANLTASAFAPSRRYGQRGSKTGFSGGYELDIDATGWLSGGTYFRGLCQSFCNAMYSGGVWGIGVGGTSLIPAVVPRIRAGVFGLYEYRLPIEAADVPLTVAIGEWSVGKGAGTANSRKNPIR